MEQIIEDTEEQVVLVDSEDRVLGTEKKMRAHQLGLLHRAFSVFILDQSREGLFCLLQQRHLDKYHCGGLWTNACCSHPRLDEPVMDAAHRRLKEELGFDVPLKRVGRFQYLAHFDNGLSEHELDHVFLGTYDRQKPIPYNTDEIAQLRWVALEDLLSQLKEQPQRYTPWFSQALECILEDLCYTS